VLTVANFNMHAGVDGWGRPFDPIAACATFDADVLVLQESWTNDADGPGSGQAERIAAALGYHIVTCPLAVGRLAPPHPDATDTWLPRLGFRAEKRALFVSSVRAMPGRELTSARYRSAQPGSWGIAVLTRLGRGDLVLEGSEILHLPTLPRDRVRRAAIVVDVTAEGVPLSIVGTHMPHLQNGSHRNYSTLKTRLRTEARPNAVLLGDMNLWGPPVRAFLPDWHRAVKGRTWPAWNPHSQIDHILVRGDVAVGASAVLPAAGSDHRPVRAELILR
jgi:endonuclease/exonuclease/phosphatase family metal-dependent hydrolase